MLLPLVPPVMTGCATSESPAADSEELCLNMEEEAELAVACRTLDLYSGNFNGTEAEMTNPDFTLDTEGASEAPEGLDFSTYDTAETSGSSGDDFNISGAPRNSSPVKACADTNNNTTDRPEGDPVCWEADRIAHTAEDLLCLTGDTQCGFPVFTEDFAHLFSSCTPADTNTQDNSFHSNTDDGMTISALDNIENVFRDAHNLKTCSAVGVIDFHENKEDDGRLDPYCPYWGEFAFNHHILSLCFLFLHPSSSLSVLIYTVFIHMICLGL